MEDEHCRQYTESLKRGIKPTVKGKAHALLAPGGLRVIKAQPTLERGTDSSVSSNLPSLRLNVGQERKMRNAISKENISPKKPVGISGKKKAGPNLVNSDTIASLQEEISYLWEIYRIDKAHQEAFLDSLASLQPKMYIQLLAKEIENLYNEKAAIQQVFVAMQKREESIKCVKQILGYLATNPPLMDIKEQVQYFLIIYRLQLHSKA